MTAWNLAELREGVKAKNPKNSTDLISLINSLGRSKDIFDYHKCLARDAFKAFDAENDPSGFDFARHVFGAAEDRSLLWNAGLVSEANLIACLSITRSAYDSFGQLVNQLVLPTPINKHPYIQDVLKKLEPSELKEELAAGISSDWFEYVHAFMNRVKHQQLIYHSASLSFVDENRGGKVQGFDFRGKHFPACWVSEVLQGTVELQNALVSCGRALNRAYLDTLGNDRLGVQAERG